MKFSPREPVPIRRIQVSDKNKKLRLILLVVFLSIGITAIGVGISLAFGTEPGWQMIEATATKKNVSNNFVFQYEFSADTSSRNESFKTITNLYDEVVERGYWIFNKNESTAGIGNVYDMNRHPNQVVTVDPVLYDALAQMEEAGLRHHYLGPVYVEYDALFRSEDEVQAQVNDPEEKENLAYLRELAGFASSPEAVSVELLGDNQVRLKVSEEYAAFAEFHEITDFVDFHWMENAFLMDFFVQEFQQAGYANGYFASYDGFTRNMDQRGTEYQVNIFDRLGNDINIPGKLTYTGEMSMVALRNFPLQERDKAHYYTMDDGRMVTSYIDPADGLYKSATDNLMGYSKTHSCSQILLELIPVFVGDSFDSEALLKLEEEGIHSIWCEDTAVCTYDEAHVITLNQDSVYELK